MAVRAAIPQLWAARLLTNLNKEHVYVRDAFNRDYEGEIRNVGDTVRIQGIGRVAEGAYTRYSDITLEQLDIADQALNITEDRYFAFTVDDAERIQAVASLMDAAMQEPAYALADRADTFAAALIRDNIDTANKLAAKVIGVGTGDDDAYETLVDLGRLLNQDNVPKAGRCVFIDPQFEAALAKDPRRVSFGTPANRAEMANGDTGMMIAGFKVYMSNNVPAGVTDATAKAIIATHPIGQTWAEQIPIGDFEMFRPQLRFEDAVKGRYLYGAKVTRPYVSAWVECTYS